MPAWDRAYMLAQMKVEMRRPASDAAWDDPTLYSFLTLGEEAMKPVLVMHAPGPMMGNPTLLTSSDGGITYALPAGAQYIFYEIHDRYPNGSRLTEGPLDSWSHDYVWEGDQIRMCRGVARSFPDGPYLQGVTPPGVVDASTDSTIQPPHWRRAAVLHALGLWAGASGQRDPAYFEGQLQTFLYGNPNIPGLIGIIGQAKKRSNEVGLPEGGARPWWRPV